MGRDVGICKSDGPIPTDRPYLDGDWEDEECTRMTKHENWSWDWDQVAQDFVKYMDIEDMGKPSGRHRHRSRRRITPLRNPKPEAMENMKNSFWRTCVMHIKPRHIATQPIMWRGDRLHVNCMLARSLLGQQYAIAPCVRAGTSGSEQAIMRSVSSFSDISVDKSVHEPVHAMSL